MFPNQEHPEPFSRETLAQLLPDILYRIPDPLASDEDAARWSHLDLADLSDAELWQEQKRVELRLAMEWDSWLAERRHRLTAERSERVRLGGTRHVRKPAA